MSQKKWVALCAALLVLLIVLAVYAKNKGENEIELDDKNQKGLNCPGTEFYVLDIDDCPDTAQETRQTSTQKPATDTEEPESTQAPTQVPTQEPTATQELTQAPPTPTTVPPTPTMVPTDTPVPPTATPTQPPAEAWSAEVTVQGSDRDGETVSLPSAGLYEVRIVSGAYNTGMDHDRTVVAILSADSSVRPCDEWNNPCADFWVGDWNSGTSGQSAVLDFRYTEVRVMAVDDLTSYSSGNSGVVTVEFKRLPS